MKYAFFILVSLSAMMVKAGEVLVIGNKAHAGELKKEDLQDLFSGRKKMIGDWRVDLIDQSTPELKSSFYRSLLDRSLTQINISWAEMIFSGRAKAPVSVTNDGEVINLVVKNANAIGYVSDKADTSQVHVILKLGQ